MTSYLSWYTRLQARWLFLRWEIRLLAGMLLFSPLVALASEVEIARAVFFGTELVLALVLFAGVWRGREEQALWRWFVGMGIGTPRLFTVSTLVRMGLLAVVLSLGVALAGVLGVTSRNHPFPLVLAGSLTAGLQIAALAALLSLIFEGATNSLVVVAVQVITLGAWLPRLGDGTAGGLERFLAGVLNPFLGNVKGPSWTAVASRLLVTVALLAVSAGWLGFRSHRKLRTAVEARDVPVFSVASLRVSYPSGWLGSRMEVVHGVDLDLEAGRILGLLGPNGAGKTSVFNGILGLADAEGTLTWSSGRPRRLATVPEHDFLPRILRGRDVLQDARLSLELPTVQELVRVLNVESLLTRPLGRLSTGQRRRVHVLVGMLPLADVLLVDEPARSVDPLEKKGIKNSLRFVTLRGTAVVIATHQLREFEDLLDDVVLIDRGKVLAHGSVAELRTRFVVLEVAGQLENGPRKTVGVVASLAHEIEEELTNKGNTVSRREPTLEELFELEVHRARDDRLVHDLSDFRNGAGCEHGAADREAHSGALAGEDGRGAERS